MHLVIITGNDCGECVRIKREGIYDRFIQAGRDNQLITEVMEISQTSRFDDIPRQYPAFIQTRMKIWVPMIFIISKTDYENGSTSDSSIKDIEVFSGKIGYNSKLKKITAVQNHSFRYGYNTITEWIDEATRTIAQKNPQNTNTVNRSTRQPKRTKTVKRNTRNTRNTRSTRNGTNARKRRTHICKSSNRVIPKY